MLSFRVTLAVAASAVLAATTGTALAEPPGHAKKTWRHVEGYDPPRAGRSGWVSRRAVRRYRRALRWGGPPPWAPAHGLREKTIVYRTYDRQEVLIAPSALIALPDAGPGRCNRDVLGGVVGGIAGAAVGSRFGKGGGKVAATVAGTVIGALIGGNIGRAMDQVDQGCVGQALERAETGRPVEWRNPDNGAGYEVTPTHTYRSADGQYCREYTTTILIDGREERAYGEACRQPDGSWQRQG